jgi:hypothetical protein
MDHRHMPRPAASPVSGAPSHYGKGLGVRLSDTITARKTTFDGTNPPIVDSHPETTTYGIKLLFCLNSMIANRVIQSPR